MFKESEVIEKIEQNKCLRGAFNIFVKMNEEKGIKLSCCRRHRTANKNRQKKAFRKGLGPEVFDNINIKYNGVPLYGYVTEVVETYHSTNDATAYKTIYDAENKNLDKSLGKWFYDMHINNTGIKNGKLICIDFDDLDEDECTPLEINEKLKGTPLLKNRP